MFQFNSKYLSAYKRFNNLGPFGDKPVKETVWRTSEGKELLFSSLTYDHISNIYWMLRVKAYVESQIKIPNYSAYEFIAKLGEYIFSKFGISVAPYRPVLEEEIAFLRAHNIVGDSNLIFLEGKLIGFANGPYTKGILSEYQRIKRSEATPAPLAAKSVTTPVNKNTVPANSNQANSNQSEVAKAVHNLLTKAGITPASASGLIETKKQAGLDNLPSLKKIEDTAKPDSLSKFLEVLKKGSDSISAQQKVTQAIKEDSEKASPVISATVKERAVMTWAVLKNHFNIGNNMKLNSEGLDIITKALNDVYLKSYDMGYDDGCQDS